jgi:hypothetical protein
VGQPNRDSGALDPGAAQAQHAAMRHDFDQAPDALRPTAYRREDSAVLTCAACGCRLTARESVADGGGYGPDAAWRHFEGNSWDRDARGHLVACADLPHRMSA